jgi:hypothetical protein
MPLTAASDLFYLDSRFGPMALVGGDPTHTRSSGATWPDQAGLLRSAIVNTPRFVWGQVYGDAHNPTALGARRRLLRLERAGANLVTADLDTWSDSGTITVTGGQPDPAGGTAAFLLAQAAGGDYALRTVTLTGDGSKSVRIALKTATAGLTRISLFDDTAGVALQNINVTWTNGVPTITNHTGSGVISPPEPLTWPWWSVAFAPAGATAAHTNRIRIFPDTGTTGSVYVYLPNVEDAPSPSSFMGIGGLRAADQLSYAFAPVPQQIAGYLRVVLRGSLLTGTTTRLFHIGAADGTAARFLVFNNGGFWCVRHESAGGIASATLAVAGAIGDTCEVVPILNTDGSVAIYQSINGGAVTSATTGVAVGLNATWSDRLLYLHSLAATSVGLCDVADVRFVKLGDVASVAAADRMQELREHIRAINGDVL